MARHGTHETEVIGELSQMKKGLEDLRANLLKEVADVDAGIARVNTAMTTGGAQRASAPPKRAKKRRTSTRRKSSSRARTTSAQVQNGSNGGGDVGAKIQALLSNAKQPIPGALVAKRLKISNGTARRHLMTLASQGAIKKAGKTKGPGRAAQLYAAAK